MFLVSRFLNRDRRVTHEAPTGSPRLTGAQKNVICADTYKPQATLTSGKVKKRKKKNSD